MREYLQHLLHNRGIEIQLVWKYKNEGTPVAPCRPKKNPTVLLKILEISGGGLRITIQSWFMQTEIQSCKNKPIIFLEDIYVTYIQRKAILMINLIGMQRVEIIAIMKHFYSTTSIAGA